MIKALSKNSLIFASIALLVVFSAAFSGSLVTGPKIMSWYATLHKPWFNPPRIAFPIVWPILYSLMAFGFWRILRVIDGGKPRNLAILTFFIQLLFNVAWSFAFFGAESPGVGMIVALGLVLSVLAMVLAFSKVDRLSSLLQTPYLAWVTFAFILNVTIWRMN